MSEASASERWHHGDAALVRGGQLGVVRADRGGDDDAGGVGGQMPGGVADVDRGAEGAQGLGGRGVLGVAAGRPGRRAARGSSRCPTCRRRRCR